MGFQGWLDEWAFAGLHISSGTSTGDVEKALERAYEAGAKQVAMEWIKSICQKCDDNVEVSQDWIGHEEPEEVWMHPERRLPESGHVCSERGVCQGTDIRDRYLKDPS